MFEAAWEEDSEGMLLHVQKKKGGEHGRNETPALLERVLAFAD